MYKAITLGALSAAIILGQGCATVTRGTSQNFGVTSEPNTAQVKFSTGMTCETPCNLKLKRNQGFSGTISKEGHKPAGFTVESKVSGGGGAGFAGNILVGGVIGMGVDAASGAMKDLKPNKVHAILVQEKSDLESKIIVPEPTEEEKLAKAEKEKVNSFH